MIKEDKISKVFGSGEGALKWKDFTRHGSLKQPIGSEPLTEVQPELDWHYFGALKNGVSIGLEGVITGYDSNYGFAPPPSCHVIMARNKASWVAFPYESRTVGIAVDGSVQLYDYERDPNTQGRHISFSTNYMI